MKHVISNSRAMHKMNHEMISVTVENKIINAALMLLGLGLIAIAFLIPQEDIGAWGQLGLMSALIISGLIPIVFCPRYHYSFRHNNIVITVGYLNLIKVKLDRNKIVHVEPIEWSPMKHFRGSGIKSGIGKFSGYFCFNLLSGRGLEIKTTEKNYVIEMSDSDRQKILAIIGDYPRANL